MLRILCNIIRRAFLMIPVWLLNMLCLSMYSASWYVAQTPKQVSNPLRIPILCISSSSLPSMHKNLAHTQFLVLPAGFKASWIRGMVLSVVRHPCLGQKSSNLSMIGVMENQMKRKWKMTWNWLYIYKYFF